LRKFSVGDDRTDAQDALVLLGRDQEESTLVRQALSLRRKVAGSGIIIKGDPGVGKSALLDRFSEIVAVSNGHSSIAKVGSTEVERLSPLALWRSVFEQLFEEELGDLANVGHDEVAEFMKSLKLDPDLIPLLSPIFSFKSEETEMTKSLSSAARFLRTNQVIVELLERFLIKLETLVLVLDDLQWCDA